MGEEWLSEGLIEVSLLKSSEYRKVSDTFTFLMKGLLKKKQEKLERKAQ
jgi:hypothetical protein